MKDEIGKVLVGSTKEGYEISWNGPGIKGWIE